MKGARWLVCLAVLVVALIASERTASAQWCAFETTPVSFGSYDVFNTVPLASTGTVTYRCLYVASMTIWLSKGQVASTNNPRQLASGTDRLNYNLYLDAGHTMIWGDPNPSQYTGGPTFLWATNSVTVYGIIPAGQDVAAGTYTDTVVVTFQF
jgi:spore coat protein U-like protein